MGRDATYIYLDIYILCTLHRLLCISLYTCDMIVLNFLVFPIHSGLNVQIWSCFFSGPHETKITRRRSILVMPRWMVTLKRCGNVRMELSKASALFGETKKKRIRPWRIKAPKNIPRWWQLKFIFVIFTPKIGEMIQFDFRIFFQMGWFNHQPDTIALRSGEAVSTFTEA